MQKKQKKKKKKQKQKKEVKKNKTTFFWFLSTRPQSGAAADVAAINSAALISLQTNECWAKLSFTWWRLIVTGRHTEWLTVCHVLSKTLAKKEKQFCGLRFEKSTNQLPLHASCLAFVSILLLLALLLLVVWLTDWLKFTFLVPLT